MSILYFFPADVKLKFSDMLRNRFFRKFSEAGSLCNLHKKGVRPCWDERHSDSRSGPVLWFFFLVEPYYLSGAQYVAVHGLHDFSLGRGLQVEGPVERIDREIVVMLAGRRAGAGVSYLALAVLTFFAGLAVFPDGIGRSDVVHHPVVKGFLLCVRVVYQQHQCLGAGGQLSDHEWRVDALTLAGVLRRDIALICKYRTADLDICLIERG